MEETRIVVVGGGFAGVYAATYLSRSEVGQQGADITLVDPRNYFTFTPLLAEVAAGNLGREHVTYPYRVLGRRYGFGFMRAAAEGLDLEKRTLTAGGIELRYDYLVVATGAEPGYFGNQALADNSLPLTSVDDALAIRGRVIGAMEEASAPGVSQEIRAAGLTFVVAGAGPAGVEVASEVYHLANSVLAPYYQGLPRAHVILADPGDRILNGWDDALAAAGLGRLRERGIDVRLGTRIQSAAPGLITMTNSTGEQTIAANTLIWTAGTVPSQWVGSAALPTERGALKINEYLQVEGQERVFAAGDLTILLDQRTGRPYPRVAPIAISQGIRAAANIENHALGRALEPYHAHHAGKIVSLGSGVAFVDLLGLQITGRLAWWIYRSAYLLKLLGLKNKLRVLFTLALNQIFERDLSSS
ncbi:MAG: NAD(P)/FAD-dependent oxidoreductase [Gemmatimonadota bacterium]